MDTSENGISHSEAKERLKEFGPNVSFIKKNKSYSSIILNQFKTLTSFLFILLLFIIFLVVLQENNVLVYFSLVLIFFLLYLSAGFLQEYWSEKVFQNTKSNIFRNVKVIREGETNSVKPERLVPGDIIIIREGDFIPAYARIIKSTALKVNHFSTNHLISGSASIISKNEKTVSGKSSSKNKKNILYPGTFAVEGECKAVVIGNPKNDNVSKNLFYSSSVPHNNFFLSDFDSNFNKNKKDEHSLSRLIETENLITINVLIACAIVMILLLLNFIPVISALIISTSLAIVSIPVAFSGVYKLFFAFSASRLSDKGIALKNPLSLEKLPFADIFCISKTGILTHNKMTVREIYSNNTIIEVSGHGYEPVGEFTDSKDKKKSTKNIFKLLACSVLCNNSNLIKSKNNWEIMGESTEGALVVLGQKAGIIKEDLEDQMPRLKENPFDSKRKLMSTVHKFKKQQLVFAKGAPEEVLKRCSFININGKIRNISPTDLKKIKSENKNMEGRSLRVLATAYKKRDSKNDEEALVFLGLVGLLDPLRRESHSTINKLKEAGINPKLITGDSREMALSIAKETGIGEYAITGYEIDKAGKDLKDIVEAVNVFARVNGRQKEKIVSALQKSNHTVASIGSKAEDLSFIKNSDIGFSTCFMGKDIAKESSDIIVKNGKLSSFLDTFRQGRSFHCNMKKYINYSLTLNFSILLSFFISVISLILFPQIMMFPLLLPLQFLLIFLVSKTFAGITLGLEPPAKDIMKKPFERKSFFIDKKNSLDILSKSFLITSGVLIIWIYSAATYHYAWTMVLSSLIFFYAFNLFNSRTENNSAFPIIFNNKWIFASLLLPITILAIIMYTPLSSHFNIIYLSPGDWLIIIVASSLFVLLVELRKLISRKIQQNMPKI